MAEEKQKQELPETAPPEVVKEIGEVPQQEQRVSDSWKPKTKLGKMVKEGALIDIEDIFKQGYRIQEAEIVNSLLPQLEEDLLLIGQAKGKFGGGQRRIFKQTQKKTKEGNKIRFSTYALVGNRDGYVGGALGRSPETVPSRDKAKRNARLHLIRIRRGCGSWQCHCREPHSIPFAVEGKSGSVRLLLFPAPRGKGLCVEKECAKVLAFAGIKDVWSKTFGQTGTKANLLCAVFDALSKLSAMKVKTEDKENLGILDGKITDEKIGKEAVVVENKSVSVASPSSESASPESIPVEA